MVFQLSSTIDRIQTKEIGIYVGGLFLMNGEHFLVVSLITQILPSANDQYTIWMTLSNSFMLNKLSLIIEFKAKFYPFSCEQNHFLDLPSLVISLVHFGECRSTTAFHLKLEGDQMGQLSDQEQTGS